MSLWPEAVTNNTYAIACAAGLFENKPASNAPETHLRSNVQAMWDGRTGNPQNNNNNNDNNNNNYYYDYCYY